MVRACLTLFGQDQTLTHGGPDGFQVRVPVEWATHDLVTTGDAVDREE
jgi:hypothetical protein